MKRMDFSKVEFFTYEEGLCVQCMHIGPYDNEPITIELMDEYAKANGFEIDINDKRYHHEIYLSDGTTSKSNLARKIIPTIYINKSTIKSGDGSISSPYILEGLE